MKENIETKDVQRTEYLDKNGLDMLWAKFKENTRNQVEVERNRAVAKENSITNSLSEFVSKTTTDVQYINSTLGILGGNMISVIDYTADGDTVSLELNSTGLEFNGSDISTIKLNGSDVNSNNGSRIIIEAHNENPQIALQSNVGSDYAFSDNLIITNKGISNADNNANHVYATDGSIADLTQYALSSTLAALEQKITANTTAISAKQDAGNYVPYELYDNDFYKILSGIAMQGSDEFGNTKMIIYSQRIQFDSNSKGDVNDEYGNSTIITAGGVSLKHKSIGETLINTECFRGCDSIGGTIFELNRNGVELRGGDDNHVLTSNASTIDITQYVLKSVYDEKIAALEARIAALEAKHAEATA